MTRHVCKNLLFCVAIILLALRCGQAQDDDWEERDKWQNVPAIIEAMDIEAGSWVADVGSKNGYLTVRLSPVVGKEGRVFAVDIDKDALNELDELLEKENISNVTTIHSVPDNPMLPEAVLDAVVIVNAYHEMDQYKSMLKHIKAALKSGGRLVLIEPVSDKRREDSRSSQEIYHEISMHFARADLEKAGFEIIEARDPFVDRKHKDDKMWLLVGLKPRGEVQP